MANNIEEKISKLRAFYTDDMSKRKLDEYERRTRDLLSRAKFHERDDVRMLIGMAKKDVQRIDVLLANDRKITETVRLALFHEKDVHQFWIERLDPKAVNDELERINRAVDNPDSVD